MFNFLNGIPVVGHAKGLIHYATGDVEEGNKAMKESTRSSVVMGAGAVGFVAGPVGSAAMGAVVGAAWDGVETIVTNEPKGYIKGIDDIVETASKGKVPIGAIFQTTVGVAADAMGGLGGGSLANTGKSVGQSVAKSVGKSVATKSATKEVTKTVIVDAANVAVNATKRELVKEVVKVLKDKVKEDRNASGGSGSGSSSTGTSTSSTGTGSTSSTGTGSASSTGTGTSSTGTESASSTGTGSAPSTGTGTSSTGTGSASSVGGAGGSGQQPPKRNPNKTTGAQQKAKSYLDEFLSAFGVQSLDQICIRGQYIFRNLPVNPEKYMKKILKALRKKKISLSSMIKTILNLFKTVKLEEVTYINFVSFFEFIMQFLYEWADRCKDSGRSTIQSPEIAGRVFTTYDYTIFNVFQELRSQIETCVVPINFRDVFAAVYHYFKHRVVDGRHELNITQYYDIIADNLTIIMNTPEYRDGHPDITFERYYEEYEAWLVIGIGEESNRRILRTTYFRDKTHEPGEDGEMYITITVGNKEIRRRLP